MRRVRIILVLSIIFTLGCGKTEENEPFSPVSSIPEISLSDVSPKNIKQFEALTFHIRYIDGDGNIGNVDADVHALEILDIRDDILHTFHVPPQSPVSGIAITGVLIVELENLILMDQNNSTEDVVFEIRLQDNKKNWSEVIETTPISIIK